MTLVKMGGMKKRRWATAGFGLFCILAAAFVYAPDKFLGGTVLMQRLRGKATVSERLVQYGAAAKARWQPYFEKKRVSYPPQKLVLVGLKREKQLQVYANNSGQPLQFIRSFPVLGLSGKLGPKLRFGDLPKTA